ncbi:KIN14B-interacting protein At4g14310-like [Bidens hawaiensis]|uniref:KIN14B-interacting protein At4g14310-like n=1 Tax=Bidens hawaiensis TaxID=980011 RepID=UPI00404B5AC9
MSSSVVRRPKDTGTGAGAAKSTASKTFRSTTPVSERVICRGAGSVNMSAGKENINSCRATSRTRAAVKPQKPIVPPMARADKDGAEPRARWSTSGRTAGRSSSPSEFNKIASDIRKARVSRVSGDRNERSERSVSAGRLGRVSDRTGPQNKVSSKFPITKTGFESKVTNSKVSVLSLDKKNEVLKESKPKPVKNQNVSEKEIISHPEASNTQSNPDSVMKVSESVKLFEKFKSKSSGLRSSIASETEENGVRLSFSISSGKFGKGSSSDGLKEKGASEDVTSSQSSVKYPSKLHGKLAFLEEKVKRIASDIKRTKEMLDLNNPDASKVMLSDIQETVVGIEKAMGDVVSGESGEKEKKGLNKVNESESLKIAVEEKDSSIKESSDTKSSAKGFNTDELEARFFPHHKLLRDRSTLKAPSGSNETLKTEVVSAVTETKQEGKLLGATAEKCIAPKVTIRGDLEICKVQETGGTVNPKGRDSFNAFSGKGNIETMLTANETLEDCDEEENKAVMIYVEEIDDSFNNQLNEIGHKASTGGWFVSEGESVLLAHDDGSCTFYDVANSEEKSIYKAPAAISPNLWRDCWIVRAPGADGCSGRYVVAASAGNSMESGFCSWDFYTQEIKSFHIEEGFTNTRTALAPVSNNVLNRRHDSTNLTPENRQWWYKPCGPLIISTASNQKGVRIYDVRDGEHIMKWDVQSVVLEMENSSPVQWRNGGKVVLAELDSVCLWDVGSLTPERLLSVSANGKKITALHVNNTDAELGGGVRQRVSSSEAEGNDGVFCTSDSINVLDFRHPSGIGLKIPKHGITAHSVFSRGDSIYLGCSGSSSSTARKPPSSSQIQQFSLRKQKPLTTYNLPESNSHPHYKAITQVWGNSNVTMGVCGSGLFVFDALKDDGMKPSTSGETVRETVGPDNLYRPTFDYMGSRALLISRDRPAYWKYLS